MLSYLYLKMKRIPSKNRKHQLKKITVENESEARIISLQHDIKQNLHFFEQETFDRVQNTNTEMRNTSHKTLLKKLMLESVFLHKVGLLREAEPKDHDSVKEQPASKQRSRLVQITKAVTQKIAKINYFVCCCLPCVANPFHMLEDHETMVISQFKEYNRTVEGGRPVFVNPFTESYEIFDNRIRSLQINQQAAFTRDFVKLLFNACIYYSLKDPARLKFTFSNGFESLIELCCCLLKNQLSKIELQDLTKHFQQLCINVENQANEQMSSRGIRIYRVYIKQVALMEQMEKLMSIEPVLEKFTEARRENASTQLRIIEMQNPLAEPQIAQSIILNKRLDFIANLHRQCPESIIF